MGLLAGINGALWAEGRRIITPSPTTALGSLAHYVTHANPATFQPMNVNFGLFPPLKTQVKGREKRRLLATRGLDDIGKWRDLLDQEQGRTSPWEA
jgi:methylenetetrahydrofolate--tRNA-(uracil-5-)-methyltransferase